MMNEPFHQRERRSIIFFLIGIAIGFLITLWLGVDFNRGIYTLAALNVVFIGFNIYGWRQWGKKEEEPSNKKLCRKFYFVDYTDLKEFVEINEIDHYEHYRPGCYHYPPGFCLNASKYHLLII